ncbi:hypothetical protein H6P81_018709 [Aristolochia fimbriata]|uniref:J domain-containing protein n=1 Tax=Aristolochia fimbriata TaxID=158543 RepID=A0AAV7E402_ARIFI|nr:hypothetical protein H6P81_018709 [Aristolochia fimbriata]
MDADIDHYEILGLPSGEEGMKLTLKEIEKAYKNKARQIHPDKNLNDPLAKSKFQQLQSSLEILKSETARKAFHDLLRAKLERVRRDYHLDAKRRKMVSDLEAREQASFAPDPQEKLRKQEEDAKKKFLEEITKIREMLAKKRTDGVKVGFEEKKEKESTGSGVALNKEKILKVSWEKGGEEYDATKLRDLFVKFGEVEDVVIRSGVKKKRSALVVMASKEAAVAATRNMCGKLSNPLLVLPLEPSSADVLVIKKMKIPFWRSSERLQKSRKSKQKHQKLENNHSLFDRLHDGKEPAKASSLAVQRPDIAHLLVNRCCSRKVKLCGNGSKTQDQRIKDIPVKSCI